MYSYKFICIGVVPLSPHSVKTGKQSIASSLFMIVFLFHIVSSYREMTGKVQQQKYTIYMNELFQRPYVFCRIIYKQLIYTKTFSKTKCYIERSLFTYALYYMQRDTSLSSCFSCKDHCTLDITLYLQLPYSFVWISHSFNANALSLL